jgi:hypothetical protein
VSAEVLPLREEIADDGIRDGQMAVVSRLEGQARGYLEEALLLLAGRLRETATRLASSER